VGSAHHLNEVVVRTHWQVDVEHGVERDTPERQLDVLLDLLAIKLPCYEHDPLEGCVQHHLA
jgi:hypothetical protein